MLNSKKEREHRSFFVFDRCLAEERKKEAEMKKTEVEEFVKMKYNNIDRWNNLKLNYQDKKLRWQIRNEYNLTIHKGRQEKHIKGHNNYVAGKSYLTIDLEEIQKIIRSKISFGEIHRTRKGIFNNKETIVSNKIIGKYINNNINIEEDTNSLTIHYSKDGVHVVPAKRRNYDKL